MWEGAWQLPVTITAEILIPALTTRGGKQSPAPPAP
jgi:hypothetical protein